jgi:cyclin A
MVLIWLASFIIAMKFEELTMPNLDVLISFASKDMTRHEVFMMEREILEALNYTLGAPTILTFLKFVYILFLMIFRFSFASFLIGVM